MPEILVKLAFILTTAVSTVILSEPSQAETVQVPAESTPATYPEMAALYKSLGLTVSNDAKHPTLDEVKQKYADKNNSALPARFAGQVPFYNLNMFTVSNTATADVQTLNTPNVTSPQNDQLPVFEKYLKDVSRLGREETACSKEIAAHCRGLEMAVAALCLMKTDRTQISRGCQQYLGTEQLCSPSKPAAPAVRAPTRHRARQ